MNNNLDWMLNWSLPQYTPRNAQIKLINQIEHAISEGYKNIVLEAGTGIGKSAIATTIANIHPDSYILTMTKQLQTQYLDDFSTQLVEIKGRSNYKCNYEGTCESCIKAEYNLARCRDCEYKIAFDRAMESESVITNYDFFYYTGVANPILDSRNLLILDEAHNFENKMLSLASRGLNREYIQTKFGIDIFENVVNKEMSMAQLKKDNGYWVDVCNRLLEICNDRIKDLEKKGNDVQVTLDEFESDPDKYRNFDYAEKQLLETEVREYKEILYGLNDNEWIVDLPDKKSIDNDIQDISVDFKPFSVSEDTQRLLDLGNIRLFLTGTLGNFNKFCEWNNIDSDETFYIYEKSPFKIDNRPIYKDFVGRMSGSKKGVPNWKNPKAITKIKEILEKHKGVKGVIHTSSNQQAFWIGKQLKEYNLLYVGGSRRDKALREFQESREPIILIGAAIKDGVDFKGDLCRFQIIFKMPFPALTEQIRYRMELDRSWYIYQTVMPLMQAYGRGIREEDDYCSMYILDSDFNRLLRKGKVFFNEYFTEAIC